MKMVKVYKLTNVDIAVIEDSIQIHQHAGPLKCNVINIMSTDFYEIKTKLKEIGFL